MSQKEEGETDRVGGLLTRITVAFEGVPRPRITKSVARGYDDEWVLSEERVTELSLLDPEQKWTEVTEEGVRLFQEYFAFSDADGWRFYLPAHMAFYLKTFPHYAWGAVYYACTSPEAKFDSLTPDQLSCVSTFLDLIHEEWNRTRS